jgi:pimeloyl-ACP methyl ester carboxylesterase
MRFLGFAVTFVLVVGAAACSSSGQPERGTIVDLGDKPEFQWGECEFDVPLDATVNCGYLTVPEDRSQPDRRKIRLHVGVFRTPTAEKAADPILYLGGGPGENSTESSSYFYDAYIEPFLKNRDFIVLDQRGAGYSRPQLDCPELDDMYKDALDEDLTLEESRARGTDAAVRCRDRLVGSEGVNLASYRSGESAADINDLRLALGYEQWNLYGVSYGTRLALTVMRDHPQGVRSVVLDSSYPLQANLYTGIQPNAQRALDVFFNGCAADAGCNSTYPYLREVFFETVAALNANPVTETIINPLSGRQQLAVVDGDALLGFLFQALYSTDYIPLLPGLIYNVANGNTELMGRIMGGFLAQLEELFSPGMHIAVQCSDEVAFTNIDEVAAAIAPYPQLRGLTEGDPFSGTGVFPVCASWGAAPPDPKENAPVASDIPTLVLAGEYDPITPPEWGQAVADTLSRRFFYVFPGVGHGVATANDCSQGVLHSFVNDPAVEPDTSCVGGLGGPDWAY